MEEKIRILAMFAVLAMAIVAMWDVADVPSQYNHFYSADYLEARWKFRKEASAAGADVIDSVPLTGDGLDGLSIDFAVFRGRPEQLLIHLCGTHGVEGFAGSAVQLAFFKHKTEISMAKQNCSAEAWTNAPTIIMVHGVNPYGFMTLRRANENNVDLNRNFLEDEFRAEILQGDPNVNGYEDVNDFLNPDYAPGRWDLLNFWFQLIRQCSLYGISETRISVLSGTYHYEKGLYYGGKSLEPELRLLNDSIARLVDIRKVRKVILADVHTGLGRIGHDSISVPDWLVSMARDVYEDPDDETEHVVGWADGAMTGYNATVGDVVSGLGAALFPQANVMVPVCHEFGTYGPSRLLRMLRMENALKHHFPAARWKAAVEMRDLFYPHTSTFWKESVAKRGLHLILKSIDYLSDNDDRIESTS